MLFYFRQLKACVARISIIAHRYTWFDCGWPHRHDKKPQMFVEENLRDMFTNRSLRLAIDSIFSMILLFSDRILIFRQRFCGRFKKPIKYFRHPLLLNSLQSYKNTHGNWELFFHQTDSIVSFRFAQFNALSVITEKSGNAEITSINGAEKKLHRFDYVSQGKSRTRLNSISTKYFNSLWFDFAGYKVTEIEPIHKNRRSTNPNKSVVIWIWKSLFNANILSFFFCWSVFSKTFQAQAKFFRHSLRSTKTHFGRILTTICYILWYFCSTLVVAIEALMFTQLNIRATTKMIHMDWND